jgi:putative tryptophan/tyrosine transport system substrate-binding protein
MRFWNRLTTGTWQALRVITFVTVTFIVLSLSAGAQPADRIYKLGFLGQTSASDFARQTTALRESLRDLGYDEGRNLIVEYRWAERKLDRLPALAAELVGLNVDAIVTHGSPGSRAAKQATSTIPIVIAVVGDPVGSGVVASLAHPGGNATGLVLQEFESTVKWLELLKQVAPRAARVGWFEVPGIEQPEVAELGRQKEDSAARSLGFAVHRAIVRGPNDLTQAFDDLRRQEVHAVIVPNTSLLNSLGVQIASLAVKHQLPTIGSPAFARSGGLVAYGPDGADMYRRAAGYVDKILKGARPGDLPMEGPTKFETIVNLKTARALALTIPPELLERANQIVE